MTRLRTRTISEKPTPANRRAGPGNGPSVTALSSNDRPAARPHQEVQDHPPDGKEDDEHDPEQLGSAVGLALPARHDRYDVEHRDSEPDQGMTEIVKHRILL